jgi:hypothetical protein
MNTFTFRYQAFKTPDVTIRTQYLKKIKKKKRGMGMKNGVFWVVTPYTYVGC